MRGFSKQDFEDKEANLKLLSIINNKILQMKFQI